MNQEFEIISHSQMNFKLFLVNMLYRTPHIHKDFEPVSYTHLTLPTILRV